MKKIIIIGSGPGGYTLALKLSNFGFNVTVIEKKNIGGTCLNEGCIPTKVLLDYLSTFEFFKEATKKEIFSGENLKVNLENLQKYQNEVIRQLGQGLEKSFKNKKINLIQGEAKFISSKKVIVYSQEKSIEIEADEIIIATGSKPRSIPGFEIDKKIIVSSDDIWNIKKVPEKVLIIGSGPIGIEFARVFNILGSSVLITEIKNQCCPILDEEISENLERSLKRRKILIKKNTETRLLLQDENKARIQIKSLEDDQILEEEFNLILIATGRKPNTENLGLEKIGINLDKAGFIDVNKFLQTNVENIYAIGDVTNFPQLAHTASFQAKVLFENIIGNKKEFSGKLIPGCIFGYPEVAFSGYSEKQLKENDIKYKIGKSLYLASGKAKASGHTEGIVKVLIDQYSEEILGAHIIGAEASSLIHELLLAQENKLKVEDIIKTIHAHPTYSEVVFEALEDSIGEAIHSEQIKSK